MRVLIVALGDWQGPARIPWALKRAGWEVGTLCRKGYACSKTRFVDQFFFVNPQNEVEVMRDIVNVIDAFQPTLIIPAMETASSALLEIWKLHNVGKMKRVKPEVIAAIERSVAKPESHKYIYSKIDLLEELARRGVRIPLQRELHTFGDADAFIQEHGYPVILKPDFGFAGSGIAICGDEEKLLTALGRRLKPGSGQRWCIQRFLDMKSGMHSFAARNGEYLTGYSLYRRETNPPPTGPSSVIEVIDHPEMEHATRELVKLMGYTGMGSTQFMVEDEGRGPAHFIEANLRVGVSMHLGNHYGPDLSTALYESFSELPITQKAPNLGTTIALYPAEVLRDPQSPYLQGIVDYVQDDPELEAHFAQQVEAKLGALR